MGEFEKLFNEDISSNNDCEFCKEIHLNVGDKTEYGSIIIYKIGNGLEDGWYATLSPKTGGDVSEDFTIQLMPLGHLTHFSQVARNKKLAENFGISFSKLSKAITNIMLEDGQLKAIVDNREDGVAIGTYGKCTTWKEKKEHLHLKLFQFRNDIGQPYTVDSSFGRKKIFIDSNGAEFIKMAPVRKRMIPSNRLDQLSKKLIELLK